MIFHATLDLDGTSQSLADAFVGNLGSIKFLAMQADGANTGLIYVGGSQSTAPTSSSYGFRIEIPASSIPVAPSIFEFPTGSISLADFNVLGTSNDKLHLLIVTA